MSRTNVDWTPDRRREHAERTRKGLERSRQRRRLLVQHVDDYRRAGRVHPSLLPLVEAHVRRGQELVTALGGFDQVTPQQLALVDQAVQAGIIRDACFALVVRDGEVTGRAVERFGGAANIERSALALLGLERRQRPIETLQQYLARNTAAEDRSGSTIASDPDPTPELLDERGGGQP